MFIILLVYFPCAHLIVLYLTVIVLFTHDKHYSEALLFLTISVGLPPPALQALCKLITASETGEQLINRVGCCLYLDITHLAYFYLRHKLFL